MGTLEEILVDDGVGRLFLAGEDGIAHFLQMSLCLRAVVIVWRTAPESLFVELDLLGIGLAIDHSAEVGVTYG